MNLSILENKKVKEISSKLEEWYAPFYDKYWVEKEDLEIDVSEESVHVILDIYSTEEISFDKLRQLTLLFKLDYFSIYAICDDTNEPGFRLILNILNIR